MSKKKAFSGSTMSLKDFHGGSIPSDLPLPSAPGVIVRTGSDRQISTAWGNNMGRSDHRLRPGSSGGARNFDEKASFLSHPAHIGRNFDEDERKPLDGVSASRRTVSDESVRAAAEPSIRQDLKPDYVSSGRISDRQVSNAVSQSPRNASSSSPVRYTGGMTPVVVNSQTPSGNTGQGVTNPHPNAWGIRKEVMGASEPVSSSVWSRTDAVSKFAKASAVEKVSSGRWQSKNPMQLLPHVLYWRDSNTVNGVDLVSERGNYDALQGSRAEKGWIFEGVQGDEEEELPVNERVRSPTYTKEVPNDDNFGGSQLQPVVPSERPKFKLLPRSKPFETSEKEGYQQPIAYSKVEPVNEVYGNTNPPKPEPTVADGGNRAVERPKLNLKPRSQPLEQSEGSFEGERKTLFGGARPRELVLKERGIDDIAINNLDQGHTHNRVTDSRKVEAMPDRLVPTARHSERTENLALDKRIGRDSERKDHRLDQEKADIQRKNWRNENWRSSRDAEKQQQQQQDLRPEPDTWRKPIEEPKPAAPDARGIRYGKVASAVELAQAFSRSVSDPKTADQFSGQRGLPGRNQIPFSRLTDTHERYSASTARHHINGY